jgi:hypothetical protein
MKKVLCFSILALILSINLNSKDFGGKNFPDKLQLGNYNLVLNGGGVIKKLLFKVYAIGLFSESQNPDPNQLINGKPWAVRMHFIYDGVSDEKIKNGWTEGLTKTTGGNLNSIKKEYDTFMSYFKGEYKENDTFQFEYIPGEGTKVVINWKLAGIIPGQNFAKALLSIWIGSEPRDKDVKNQLLGK